MKARFTSTAEIELQKAIEFYEAAENGLGAKFLDEVEAAVERIVLLQTRGQRCPRERDVAGPAASRMACFAKCAATKS